MFSSVKSSQESQEITGNRQQHRPLLLLWLLLDDAACHHLRPGNCQMLWQLILLIAAKYLWLMSPFVEYVRLSVRQRPPHTLGLSSVCLLETNVQQHKMLLA